MNMMQIEKILLSCMILNLIVSGLVMIAVLFFKKEIFAIHSKIFGISEEAVAQTIHRSSIMYKTIFFFFNVIPYVAIVLNK